MASWRRLRIKSRIYSLIEPKARAAESAFTNSASSGFSEMLMVTAFMQEKLCFLAVSVKPWPSLPNSQSCDHFMQISHLSHRESNQWIIHRQHCDQRAALHRIILFML